METVYVFTSDKRNWLLKGFAYQWQKYAPPANVVIVGYKPPEFTLPDNFRFMSLGNMDDYPANKWSDALIEFLTWCKDEYVPIFLEDYWLMRPVHNRALQFAHTFAASRQALRVDLTTDRLYCGAPLRECESLGCFDFFESPFTPYQMSLQASIWHRDQLLSLLIPGESPWELEINGNERIRQRDDLHIYGNRQWLFKYQIMVNKGELSLSGHWMFPPRQLSETDLVELRAQECLPFENTRWMTRGAQ